MKNLLLFALTLAISCTSPAPTETATEPDAPEPAYLPSLQAAFDAHGKLENWKKYKTLTFTRRSGESQENHTIDLENRKVRISSEDYELGFDGQDVWVSPDKDAYSGRSARFFHNLWFYFFSIPHILSDPGVNASDMEDVVFNGKNYKRIMITFGDNVGDAPDDKYLLYLSEDNRLDFINYSVTYYDPSRTNNFNALVYEDWQEVDGLLVPGTMKGYRWENDTIGDQRYEVQVSEIAFSAEKADQAIFEVPEGAYVDVKESD